MGDDVKWTAKGPALIVGLLLLVAGVLSMRSRWKYAILGGFTLLIIGSGLVWYSLTIKEWCAQRDIANSPFSSAFSGSFHSCLKQKGWLEF